MIVLILFILMVILNALQLNEQLKVKPLKYLKKHSTAYYSVCAVAILHIYAMKLLSSHFYMFDMFKAEPVPFGKWVWVGFFSVLAAVGLWGAVTTEPSQLYISQIETVILSMYSVLLTLCESKVVLNTNVARVSSKLKLKVNFKRPFQNSKLESLLALFGPRLC